VLNNHVDINITLTHITTDVNEITEGISIFPNPATDRFQVSLSGNNQPMTISLSNQHGQLVETRNLGAFAGEQQLDYDMEGFASGVYFLRIETADNVHVYKVVLQ
jgi:uncharacterized protein (DUF1684 family)